MCNNTHDGHNHKSKKSLLIFGERTEFIFALLSGFFLGSAYLLHFLDAIHQNISISGYILAYVFGGFFTTIEAYKAIRHGKFEIDFLMIFAAIGAGFLGEWAEGALLLFLFSLGHALEHMAMSKARKSINALSDLAPPTAILMKGETQIEVPVEALSIGDIVLVKPNSKIPADGLILEGNSMVNQAAITGESIPVQKYAAPEKTTIHFDKLGSTHKVFSGSINGNLSMKIHVQRIAEDSTVARLIQMVSEAEQQKSPTQHFTDKFEKIFVPIVLILVIILMLAFMVLDETFSQSFYRAMAVLVSASPCALAISTPSAVLAGIARAARSGVLIKGGKPLENLGQVKVIAFDKTGTLTEGKPVLTSAVPIKKDNQEELLLTAAAVESLSDHPLAAAIVKGCTTILGHNNIPHASKLRAITARGVEADVEGQKVFIGNRLLMEETTGEPVPKELGQLMHTLEIKGETAMIVRKKDAYLGIVAVMDVARAEAKCTLMKLKKLGIDQMVMLTGDHQNVANAIANKIGITNPLGNLLPEDKVEAIKKLSTNGGRVAMVGDGVNDAPAMATSAVGIAMGAAGSAVALETADVALMADKLEKLPFAIKLSRKANAIIRQNLWISLGMVAILMPLTILGIASIGPAVVAHEGSTLLVVLNALRLLGIKE